MQMRSDRCMQTRHAVTQKDEHKKKNKTNNTQKKSGVAGDVYDVAITQAFQLEISGYGLLNAIQSCYSPVNPSYTAFNYFCFFFKSQPRCCRADSMPRNPFPQIRSKKISELPKKNETILGRH